MKPANLIAESDVYMKSAEIKTGVYKVICLAAKKHGQALSLVCLPFPILTRQLQLTDNHLYTSTDAQMTVMQNLQYTEHLSEPMAELVNKLAKEYDYSQLGEDVLRFVLSFSWIPLLRYNIFFVP